MYSIEDIKTEFHIKRINKEEAIKRLVSTLERLEEIDYGPYDADIHNYWNALDAEVEAIDALRKLKLKSDKIFSVLENAIVSEQEFLVKITALNAVSELFPKKCDGLLKWLSENDSSFKSIVNERWLEAETCYASLAILYDNIMWSNDVKLKELREIVRKKTDSIVQRYIWEGVNPIEAKILTIFELEIPDKLNHLHKDFDCNHYENDFFYKDFDCYHYENDFFYKMNDKGHVTEIWMRFLESNKFILHIIPQKIHLLQSLENLILVRSGIRVIPDSIGKLKNLKVLNLSFNNIGDLTRPKYFPENLEKLSLRNNRIKTIPEAILKLRNLKKLELCYNQIEKLPESFENLTKLKKICLINNKISQVPKSLKDLKSATLIDLQTNPVRRLTAYFDTEMWRSKIKVDPPLIDPLKLLSEYASKLGLDAEAEASARETLKWYITKTKIQEENPKRIVIGTLYYLFVTKGYKINNKKFTLKNFIDILHLGDGSYMPTCVEITKLQSVKPSTN